MPGAVDWIDNFRLVGWACSEDGKNVSRLRVDVDGVPSYVFIPRDYRADLARAGWVGGYCSLDITFPHVLGPFKAVRVEVWNEDTKTCLKVANLVPAISIPTKYMFTPPIDVASAHPIITRFDGDISITEGISVYPSTDVLKAERITGDAKIISLHQEVRTPILLKELNLTQTNFVLSTQSPPRGKPFSVFRLAPMDSETDKRAFAGYVATLPRPPAAEETPPLENMIRVSGVSVTPEIFVAAGLTTAAKLDAAARAFGGKPLSRYHRILDWGSGVGRVARHISNHFAPNSEVHCVDVDTVNVEMARRFLPRVVCELIPFYPPTEMSSNYFDFIYGISVFTHLTESAQEVWLSELARIAKPGALVIMTVSAEFAALSLSSAGTVFPLGDLLQIGIADRLMDRNLGIKLAKTNYYRSTFHLSQYIKGEWTKYFEILDIIHRSEVHIQDFVIMRKREA